MLSYILMLLSTSQARRRTHLLGRYFQSSSNARYVLRQIEKGSQKDSRTNAVPNNVVITRKSEAGKSSRFAGQAEKGIKRNEVGVQLLSRKLHEQIFKNVSFPAPDRSYVRLAREHLEFHGLDPTQGSILPETNITLPPLQGNTIDEHFYRIGSASAQPWLDLAKQFASVDPPPKPDYWHIQPGWTKYYHKSDGSSFCESVSAPEEEMLSFDVETLPNYHPYAVMACAVSSTHWYSWVSPWLLGETDEPQQLIPLGNSEAHRVVVGHNISYDRARILEEYHINGTNTRFLDTMSLHVAVKGISSHQRPAWMKYKKSQKEEQERKEEALEVAVDLLRETEERQTAESDSSKRAELRKLQQDIRESLPQLFSDDSGSEEAEATSKRWEDITSANSLADVARLHCDIDISKDIRNDFMTHSREEILENIQDYLDYCSSDVSVTHSVFAKVFPDFLKACPSPVSFSGILTMGSSFLTVNEQWEEYLRRAEGTYQELEEKVRSRLIELAGQAKTLFDTEGWKSDVWLSQLDWTPKVAGKSRGFEVPPKRKDPKSKRKGSTDGKPMWLSTFDTKGPFSPYVKNRIIPLLLRFSYDGHPLHYSTEEGWTYSDDQGQQKRPFERPSRVLSLIGKTFGLKEITSGRLSCTNTELAIALAKGDESEDIKQQLHAIANEIVSGRNYAEDPWLSQLDWYGIESENANADEAIGADIPQPVIWPKWFWDLTAPKKDLPRGTVDITVRNRFAPLLLRLSWSGWPLFHSRQHGWIFRVAPDAKYETRLKKLNFHDPNDTMLQEMVLKDGYIFYKLPHKDGELANVGSPFGKSFVKYAQDGILTSPGREAKDALDLQAQCSYWISSRDRILKQMVVWEKKNLPMGIQTNNEDAPDQKWGVIIPQVITMGTVTRRAIEKTWLTASNAKKNRVGSELKAMVRAPKGYAIVGADVDSEELWISSAMGDAQFGLHGATALGWMTLEGTKAAGTDLHSKTASILGISRDQAKVFNYSRIYGAGKKHAILLLLQSNPNMLPDVAEVQAEKLYASTKGKNTHRPDLFGRKFWFGGTESFVFNKLEEIALSDNPQTPALGCGITHALSKEYLSPGFGTDYMTSRINWVVQSSGVDYLHLLIVSMEHLLNKYNIQARYLISVHDELRYLVKEEDKYRAALALQVANLWTRCLFAYRLGMDDLPQGVAFFSAVDVDTVLRKEVDLPCVTPSQPVPIPPGESLNITQVLEKTNGGSLWADGRPMQAVDDEQVEVSVPLDGYSRPNCLAHRASSAKFLRAQATAQFGEVKRLAELDSGRSFEGGIGGFDERRKRRVRKSKPIGNATVSDWDATSLPF